MRLPPPDTKTFNVLMFFLMGKSANRFEAEVRLHDHCLHSTVSTLQNFYGIKICRLFETVQGFKGKPTRCCRYWMAQEERVRVTEVMANGERTNRVGFFKSPTVCFDGQYAV